MGFGRIRELPLTEGEVTHCRILGPFEVLGGSGARSWGSGDSEFDEAYKIGWRLSRVDVVDIALNEESLLPSPPASRIS
jgi:hypothetical protein